jgi:hypothetical protein
VRWKESLLFWRLGQQVDFVVGRGGAGDGKEEKRQRQGNTGERSAELGAGKVDARKDAWAVWADTFRAQI